MTMEATAAVWGRKEKKWWRGCEAAVQARREAAARVFWSFFLYGGDRRGRDVGSRSNGIKRINWNQANF